MIKTRLLILYFAIFTLILTNSVFADEINLKNGDRLTGKLIRMEESTLYFVTTYAEELKIKWEDVACISSENEYKFVLTDGEILIGKALCQDGIKFQIEGVTILETRDLLTTEIKAINPSPPPSAVKYKANLNAGGSISDGNTNSKAANASGKFEARSKRQRFTLRSKYNYGETDGELTKRNSSGSFKYDFFIFKGFYSYAHSLFERDDFQDLNLRSILGLGVGYQFLDTDRYSLNAETGISYFNVDYDTEDDEHYVSARWSVGFDIDLILDRVKLFHLHEGYYSLEESNSYYITSEQGIRIHIANNFYTNFQVDYTYNNKPAVGREKSDTTYILGLSYEYNF